MSKEAELEFLRGSVRAGQIQRFFSIVRPKYKKFEYSDERIMELLNDLSDETLTIICGLLNKYPVGKVPVHLFELVVEQANLQHFRDIKQYMPLLDYRHFESIYALQHYRAMLWFPSADSEDQDRVLGFLTTMNFLVHSIAYAPATERAAELKKQNLRAYRYGLDENEYLIPLDERLPQLIYENLSQRGRLISIARERGSIDYDLMRSSLESHTALVSGAL